jgi:hypothetical protein
VDVPPFTSMLGDAPYVWPSSVHQRLATTPAVGHFACRLNGRKYLRDSRDQPQSLADVGIFTGGSGNFRSASGRDGAVVYFV